ncbi:hypothetical protein [Pseudocitrobacter vendiensis]|uniref:Uncharacterized protein n=1 Tax=Pseudocitrobacter vendiensis TaxID=2488306 RepID=A0ABM9FE35_9ENTR|nr:hypothetical protein [Pseudocitrobacter vendiensis]CAH6661216.1 hypothetical protein FBBNIHIM_19090 [Pseudocitrobacter vendiensis]
MSKEKLPLPGIQESERALNFEAACRKKGLFILLIIIFLAIGGLFSNGYLSQAVRKSPDQKLQVEYERFGRLQMEFALKVSAQPERSGLFIFSLHGNYNQYFEIGNVWPKPDKMYSHDDTLFLVYQVVEQTHPFTVWLYATPQKFGYVHNSLGLNTGSKVDFWQFIYP